MWKHQFSYSCLLTSLKLRFPCLGWVAQVIGTSSIYQNDVSSIPGHGKIPRLQVWSHQDITNRCHINDFSLFLSLASPPSSHSPSNQWKHSLWRGFKKLRFPKNIHLCELYLLIFTISKIKTEKKFKYIVTTAFIPAKMPAFLPTIAFKPPVPTTNNEKGKE